jgi:eukaryotic-like serine/threonine-protein kinase
MSLAPGTRLEHYEILGPLGVGGMGEVYRAQDTRLRREVAIKILPAQFAADPGRLARFEREAQVLAALNHPNIAAIYGLGQATEMPASGVRFLVLELVEGPTLAERIHSGPIPVAEALRFAAQIAEALSAAHDKGIVHRDLKPANVKIKPDGTVKVLDFGLAAVVQPQMSESTDPTNSPTLTMGATQAGVIMGTAGYMCPEQARGSSVDKRADIWGFGVVLYEMVTGRRLFQGDTVSDTLASVLKEQPDLDRVPLKVRRLIKKCLEKDPKRRLRDIGDAWELLDVEPSVEQAISVAQASSLRQRLSWALLALALLALAAVSLIHFRETPPARELTRFEIPAPPGATLSTSAPAVSPDGRKLAFLATGADQKRMIWVRSLDSEEARPLLGTEGARVDVLIWSPDSRTLAFASGGKLKKIEATGGPAQILCDDQNSGPGGAWTSDNRIIFGTTGPLQIVSAAGGAPTPLTVLDRSRNEVAHAGAVMLPDGHHFLYLRLSIPFENGGVYIGSLDSKPEQQSSKRLLPDITNAVYVPPPGTRDTPGDSPGLLLFVRGVTLSSASSGGTLMAQPFDPKRMEFMGDAVPIAQQVGIDGFSASPTGVLAFSTTAAQGNSQLTWYDRKGNVLSAAGEPGEYSGLSLSPDGSRVAYERGNDLWLFEFARGLNTKFTFGNLSVGPAWSADGSRIAFVSIRGSGFGIYQKASNSSGQEQPLYQSSDRKYAVNWIHDGKFLMYYGSSSDEKKDDLWILPADGSAADRKPLSFLRTDFEERDGRFSPDSRWVAYQSNQSGKLEIYVLPFDESNPGSSAGAGLNQVSKEGGAVPHWRGDGKELFYDTLDGYLMSVGVTVKAGAFQPGTPQRLFKLPATGASWDVSADGKKFLIAAPASSGSAAPASQPFHVVMNWTEMLKR